MELDSRTILFVTACMGPLLSLVLLSMRTMLPSNFDGMGSWAMGAIWMFFGVIFVALREVIPLGLSIVVGNALVFAGTWQWLLGTDRFLGLRMNHRVWWSAIALVILGVAWFYFVQPSFYGRSVLICSIMVALLGVHARALWRYPYFRYACRFLSLALLAAAGVWVLRLAGILSGVIQPGLFQHSALNTIVNGAQAVSGLMIMIGFMLLATERVRHEVELLAARDSLTGALMRRAWNVAALAEVDRSRRHKRALSLVAMDLDHFKLINDAHGHAVGDQVLAGFVAMVNRHLRGADQLGRMGGEEFVLLLPETSLEDALLVAERIRKATETLKTPCSFTVSMGVAHLTAADANIQALLDRADVALYRAKTGGRNRVERESAGSDGTPLPQESLPIKSALRRA